MTNSHSRQLTYAARAEVQFAVGHPLEGIRRDATLVPDLAFAQVGGNQEGHGPLQEVVRSVSEETSRLLVGEDDSPLFVHDQQSVRAGFHEQLEEVLGEFQFAAQWRFFRLRHLAVGAAFCRRVAPRQALLSAKSTPSARKRRPRRRRSAA